MMKHNINLTTPTKRGDDNSIIIENEKEKLIKNKYEVMDDVQILRSKVVSQNNIIKSYKSWVNILLGMVNTNGSSYTPNLDFATTIEKNLERMKNISSENLELAKNVNKERIKSKESNIQLDSLKNQLDIMKDDMKNSNMVKLNNEKKQVLDGLTSLTEELEYLSDKNKVLEEKINKNPKVSELLKRIEALRLENEEMKEVIKIREEFKVQNQRYNE